MKKFVIKTKSLMEQKYIIEAKDIEEAKKIALRNTKDVIEQTQISEGEILEVIETID
jgi:hypothetical protein